ncbi:ketol-acid reductoisomerase, partial [Saccharophagus degradans]|nr:ketol-acid reductoisomerase [Saccharophagus degradans]
AEYGCYLFDHACKPLIAEYVNNAPINLIGKPFGNTSNGVDNAELIAVNKAIREHEVEYIGEELRESMTAMKKIVS